MLCACAGKLDDPGRFAYVNAPPDGGTVSDEGDGGCDPLIDIFPPSCSTSACHAAESQQGGLDLQSAGLPQRLVGKRAAGGPGFVIDQANPLQSVLLTKLQDPPPYGFQMPLGAPPLTDDETACLTAWVQAAVSP
ncbi:MAG TPA: hypothetical protein VLW85_18465 [Myxococcales bacterium]|nr:hypothetical protein [Myxococcales bacterium]